MQLDQELQPALAAISGGLGDIGMAIARVLHEAGAEVALADLPRAGPAADGFFFNPLDVTDAGAVENWYKTVTAHFGRGPNLIIPNAATVTFKGHLDITSEEWNREIDVNLNGAFHFANAGIRKLVDLRQPGRVIFIGSWAGHAPHAKLPAYCVAKAGLRMLTQTLALELASRQILVNEVAPGYVNAGLSGRAFAADPELAISAREGVPLGKLLSAHDVALQVLHLCSPAATHITGTTILQDGGLSLLRGPLKS